MAPRALTSKAGQPGTRDILPAERVTWSRLERTAAALAALYGYREIETPLIEQTEVFERGVGEVTDVVPVP